MFRILTILLLSTLFPNVTNNGATLTIGSDVSVFIDGNFINNTQGMTLTIPPAELNALDIVKDLLVAVSMELSQGLL